MNQARFHRSTGLPLKRVPGRTAAGKNTSIPRPKGVHHGQVGPDRRRTRMSNAPGPNIADKRAKYSGAALGRAGLRVLFGVDDAVGSVVGRPGSAATW